MQITCKNRGSVSEENLNRLTHRFWRGSMQPGSGLGLSVVEALATQFNGDVVIQNDADNMFCVSVQLRTAPLY